MKTTATKHVFPYDMTKELFESLLENMPAAFKNEAFNEACPASSLLQKVAANLSKFKDEESFIKEHGELSYDLCQLFVAMQTLTMLAEMDEEESEDDDSDFDEDEDEDSDFDEDEDEDEDSDFDEDDEDEDDDDSEEELSMKKPHLHLMSKKNGCCGGHH